MRRLIICLGLILFQVHSFSKNSDQNLKLKTKSRSISALILFYGDYKNQQQFDGNIQQQIKGVLTESKDFKADVGCEWNAYFQEVFYRKAPHLKLSLTAHCQTEKSTQKIILSPEYIRLKDLKVDSSGFYFTDRYKNVQFKIVELSYH